MKFEELQLAEPPKIIKENTKRFIIGCDPFDKQTIENLKRNLNTFVVFDKGTQKVISKIETTSSFDDFVEWFLKKERSRIPYFVSHKFIKNGKPCNIEEARTRAISS